MKKYKNLLSVARKTSAVIASLALIAGGILPLILNASAEAGTISTRSIKLSSAAPSAAGVSYQLTFTPVTTTQELIVDFCSDTPLIGTTCAFAASTVPNVTGVTASVGTVATVGTGTPVHTIKVTGLTMTGGTPFTITFGGITNPSSATSFYARVLTYATGNSSGYVPANTTGGTTTTGTYVDDGGDALSTATTIQVTAAVMETLTFCTSGATLLNSTCTSATNPNVTIGGSLTPPALSTTAVETGTDYIQLSTNAQSGAIVYLKALYACSGLSSDGGSTCPIPGVGAFAPAPAAGTAFFGLNVSAATNNTTGGSGTVTANANYGTTSGDYGMGTNVTTTYGDPITSSSAPVAFANQTLTWAAQASNVTPPGIYYANESLVATGTF